jgi:hypothetical protein
LTVAPSEPLSNVEVCLPSQFSCNSHTASGSHSHRGQKRPLVPGPRAEYQE